MKNKTIIALAIAAFSSVAMAEDGIARVDRLKNQEKAYKLKSDTAKAKQDTKDAKDNGKIIIPENPTLGDLTKLEFEKAMQEAARDTAKAKQDAKEASGEAKKDSLANLPQVPPQPSPQEVMYKSVRLSFTNVIGTVKSARIQVSGSIGNYRLGERLATGETIEQIEHGYIILSKIEKVKKPKKGKETTEVIKRKLTVNGESLQAQVQPVQEQTTPKPNIITPFDPEEILRASDGVKPIPPPKDKKDDKKGL